MKKPTLWEIKTAVLKNISAPDLGENNEFTFSRSIRASSKREGDSQLGILLFVGIADHFGYSPSDIKSIMSLENAELKFKLAKYRRRCKQETGRFANKIKLVKNYLKLVYGIS